MAARILGKVCRAIGQALPSSPSMRHDVRLIEGLLLSSPLLALKRFQLPFAKTVEHLELQQRRTRHALLSCAVCRCLFPPNPCGLLLAPQHGAAFADETYLRAQDA